MTMYANLKCKDSAQPIASQSQSVKVANEGRAKPVGTRLTAVAQHDLIAMAQNSSRVIQQNALSSAIHASPRMVMQRQQMYDVFGDSMLPQKSVALEKKLLHGERLEEDTLHESEMNEGPENAVSADVLAAPAVQMKRRVVQLANHPKPRRNKVRRVRADHKRKLIRGGEQRSRPDLENESQRRSALLDYRATSTFRTALSHGKAAFANYPEGSYAHGRYMYLNQKLQGLGAGPKSLKDLGVSNMAPVEVDHSPHDGAQRIGPRQNNEALNYRVAVPLPRNWHRRHQTTHGAGATRHSAAFSDAQVDLVKNNNYAKALQNHLLDTFHSDAIGNTGQNAIKLVALRTIKALDYAASDEIKVSIHQNHVKNTPAITEPEKKGILLELGKQFEKVKLAKKMPALANPFTPRDA